MTTHKIDPGMVRQVLGYSAVTPNLKIIIEEKRIIVAFNDNQIFDIFDIHRFKDMAIEWCAGKGYYIERKYNGFMGEKGMFDVGIALYQGNGCDEVRGFDYDPKTTSISNAELAAIDFVYKQIQKEKKDENN